MYFLYLQSSDKRSIRRGHNEAHMQLVLFRKIVQHRQVSSSMIVSTTSPTLEIELVNAVRCPIRSETPFGTRKGQCFPSIAVIHDITQVYTVRTAFNQTVLVWVARKVLLEVLVDAAPAYNVSAQVVSTVGCTYLVQWCITRFYHSDALHPHLYSRNRLSHLNNL